MWVLDSQAKRVTHQVPLDLVDQSEQVVQRFVEVELAFTRLPVGFEKSGESSLPLRYTLNGKTHDPVSTCALWLMFAADIRIKFWENAFSPRECATPTHRQGLLQLLNEVPDLRHLIRLGVRGDLRSRRRDMGAGVGSHSTAVS